MEQEKAPQQKIPYYSLIEHIIDTSNEDLPQHELERLVEAINNERSFDLLVRYIKINIKPRLKEVIRAINFDFATSEESFDVYNNYIEVIEQLLEEKDGVKDTTKRERVRLFLKAIKNTSIDK